MRLVGATMAQIKRPFLYCGAVYGLEVNLGILGSMDWRQQMDALTLDNNRVDFQLPNSIERGSSILLKVFSARIN